MMRTIAGALILLSAFAGCALPWPPRTLDAWLTAEEASESEEGDATPEADSLSQLVRMAQEELPPPTPSVGPPAQPPSIDLPPTVPELDATELTLRELIESIYDTYPLLVVAEREREIAEGNAMAAWGAFDLNLGADSIARPLGFYQTYRNSVSLTQPLWGGGAVFGGYRIGRGNFPTWHGFRDTNDGGEFAAGVNVPLLRDRSIDARRAAIARTALERQAVEPVIQAQLLDFVLGASQLYWTWVAAGQSLEVQRDLLRITTERNAAIRRRVELDDLPEIELIDNERLIAARDAQVIAAERRLQETSIELSLFLRTPQGQPIVPTEDQLPGGFPTFAAPDPAAVGADIEAALANRPELRELELLRAQVQVDLAQAENLLQPGLNAMLVGSQDVGAPASPLGDKTPFELEASLMAEVPLQRREARGRIRTARGQLAQLGVQRQFMGDRIVTQIQDAMSALETAFERIERARQNLQLARRSLVLEERAFELGDSSILMINFREQAVIDAALVEIDATADFLRAAARYRAALAVDPLSE